MVFFNFTAEKGFILWILHGTSSINQQHFKLSNCQKLKLDHWTILMSRTFWTTNHLLHQCRNVFQYARFIALRSTLYYSRCSLSFFDTLQIADPISLRTMEYNRLNISVSNLWTLFVSVLSRTTSGRSLLPSRSSLWFWNYDFRLHDSLIWHAEHRGDEDSLTTGCTLVVQHVVPTRYSKHYR